VYVRVGRSRRERTWTVVAEDSADWEPSARAWLVKLDGSRVSEVR
jgi:hypothetical protein